MFISSSFDWVTSLLNHLYHQINNKKITYWAYIVNSFIKFLLRYKKKVYTYFQVIQYITRLYIQFYIKLHQNLCLSYNLTVTWRDFLKVALKLHWLNMNNFNHLWRCDFINASKFTTLKAKPSSVSIIGYRGGLFTLFSTPPIPPISFQKWCWEKWLMPTVCGHNYQNTKNTNDNIYYVKGSFLLSRLFRHIHNQL